jgi:hypothetical protein
MSEKFEGAIVLLDILGFKNMIKTQPLEKIRDKVINLLMKSAEEAKYWVERDLIRFHRFSNNNNELIPIKWIYFSDTIFVYLKRNPQDNSIIQTPDGRLDSISYFCSLLLAKAITENILLRGAISYGECLISNDPAYFIGIPILEAYELEKKQEWSGIVFTESAMKYLSDDTTRLVKWDIPFKNTECKNSYTVNWAFLCDKVNWDNCFNSSSKDVITKKENTKIFYDNFSINKNLNNIF